MNLSLLKTLGPYISLISGLLATLVASGLVLSGSTLAQVLTLLVSILGVLGGHQVTANSVAAKLA